MVGNAYHLDRQTVVLVVGVSQFQFSSDETRYDVLNLTTGLIFDTNDDTLEYWEPRLIGSVPSAAR